MKKNLIKLAGLACVVALCGALAACAPAAPAADDAAEGDHTELSATGDGMYESDEACMSCHGGTYEAVAALTADYGLSNPHDSIHGGSNSCVNCHAKDKEVTDNQCTKCHSWPHNPEQGLGA